MHNHIARLIIDENSDFLMHFDVDGSLDGLSSCILTDNAVRPQVFIQNTVFVDYLLKHYGLHQLYSHR